MNSILRFETLLPIFLLVVQAFVLLFICFFTMRKLKILSLPYAGMDYAQLIVASSLLFGVFLIATSDTVALFQAFKTFQNGRQNIFSDTLTKFSQFFLVVLLFELIFVFISFFISKMILGFKKSSRELEEGNIPASILMAIIILGFAIVLQSASKEIVGYIVPKYINFN